MEWLQLGSSLAFALRSGYNNSCVACICGARHFCGECIPYLQRTQAPFGCGGELQMVFADPARDFRDMKSG